MTPAPAWLSYASPAIAAVAFVLALLTFRRGGPRVRARARVSRAPRTPGSPTDLIVTLRVRNTGLAPVDIETFYLGAGSMGAGLRLAEIPVGGSAGTQRPVCRMDGTSVRTWTWNFRAAVLDMFSRGQLTATPSIHFRGSLLPLPALFIAVALATGEAHARFSPVATLAMYREFKKMAEPEAPSPARSTEGEHGKQSLAG